ncbi:hypothetical protein [Novosphingobium sp. AP12]|uniref:hypothetical protein n=1 Tax=Novosphingobium sp. AP12 TaxID=1144305 RepID=UPI000304C515|nr:hypothetical protein [Novosphingobium sp. AP12]
MILVVNDDHASTCRDAIYREGDTLARKLIGRVFVLVFVLPVASVLDHRANARGGLPTT